MYFAFIVPLTGSSRNPFGVHLVHLHAFSTNMPHAEEVLDFGTGDLCKFHCENFSVSRHVCKQLLQHISEENCSCLKWRFFYPFLIVLIGRILGFSI